MHLNSNQDEVLSNCSNRVGSVLVVGGGSAGLLAALTLKIKLSHLSVTMIRSAKIGVIGVGEGTTVNFPAHLHGYLNIDPGEFLKITRPSWKLGIRFLWGTRPYFDYTFSHQVDWKWDRLNKSNGFYCGNEFRDVDYSSALMSAGKAFLRKENGDPLIERTFGYHLDNGRLVEYLERLAVERGIAIQDGEIEDTILEEKGIQAVRLVSGQIESADLFIDASGFSSLLLGKALREPYVDFRGTLLCDRALVGTWDREDDPVLPYTLAETMDAGWCWQIEHPQRIARGYVYSSDFITDDQAEHEFRAKNPKLDNAKMLRFPSGCYRRSWVKNVVAVGNASGFVEPLEATSLHCICHESRILAEVLSASDQNPGPLLIASFNKSVTAMWDQVRWFLGVHYKFNSRLNTAFWQTCRQDVDIGPAEPVVDFYRENGPVSVLGHTIVDPTDMFTIEGYWTMLVGMNVPYVRRYVPATEDQCIWSEIIANNRKLAHDGLTINEAFNAVQSPEWQWVPGYFSDNGNPAFNR